MKIDSILEDKTSMAILYKLSGKFTHLKELPERVHNISLDLKLLRESIMADMNLVSLADDVIKIRIGQVRNLAYHIQDVMDKYSYHVVQYNNHGGGFTKNLFAKGAYHVKVFSEITDDLAEVGKEMHRVRQLRNQWLKSSQLGADPLTEMEKQRSEESFPVIVNNEDLVGIEDNRILLTEWLHSKEPKSNMIAVSGMAGLGKSTLVATVYKREKFNFHAHAWIVVSQIHDGVALLRKLLWKIGYTEQPLSAGIDKMQVHDLRREIQKRLENRKYLIVLDDVCRDQEVYYNIHHTLGNLQGSRIIITTRMNHFPAIYSPTRHLELQPLSTRDAFHLFCRRAFYNQKGHRCPEDLEMIAADIVDRCQGLPLTIVKMGSMLSSTQRLDIWAQKYNQLSSELSNNYQVRSVYNLIYHDLSDDLKNCLLYCTLFPEDQPMSRDSLVRLWVAEGLVQLSACTEWNQREILAQENLMELISSNMLELVEEDELEIVKTCKMNAIMRELAISIAKEERFASANDYGTLMQMDKNVRRLSLCGWRDNNTTLKLELPHLRTVVAAGVISYSPGFLSSVLSESIYLTVLELQDSEVTEVPASIGSLFNLRYIGLRRTKVKSLPDCIENLSNLQTLDIKETKIQKLPRRIAKIKKLRHLLADRYDDEKQSEFPCFIGVQAPENLSSLEELQTLETVNSSNDLAEKLTKLMQLRSVSIDRINAADCANLFATLSHMRNLSSLFLSASDNNEVLHFEALQPRFTDLSRLIIRGQLAEGTHYPIFLAHRANLKYLDLSWCHLGEDPLRIVAPQLPNLTCLKLSNMPSGCNLLISADYFPNLKTLVLKHMHDVSQINIIDGALPSIQGLYIVSLPKLDKIPQGIESLRSLKKLWLLGLHSNFKWVTNILRQKMLHVPEIRV
ncbi:hypothetical protein ACQ4PT_049242 [Festuca glaucescens]